VPDQHAAALVEQRDADVGAIGFDTCGHPTARSEFTNTGYFDSNLDFACHF
jgi:hypothetical protein